MSGRDGNVRHSIPADKLENLLNIQRNSLENILGSEQEST